MAVQPFSTITPRKAEDVVKGLYLKKQIPISRTIGSILVERCFDILILAILIITGLIFYYSKNVLYVVAMALFIVIIGLMFLHLFKFTIPRRWLEKFNNLILSFKRIKQNPKTFFLISSY